MAVPREGVTDFLRKQVNKKTDDPANIKKKQRAIKGKIKVIMGRQ